MAVKTENRTKKAVTSKAKAKSSIKKQTVKAKATRKKGNAAKTVKAEKVVRKTEAKKTLSLPKTDLSNMAQIIYMATIIIFLAFVILKYHEII